MSVTLKVTGSLGSIAGKEIIADTITIQPIQAHLIDNGASVAFHICDVEGNVIFNNFGQPKVFTEAEIAGWNIDNFIVDLLLQEYNLIKVIEDPAEEEVIEPVIIEPTSEEEPE
jgi:hypothetical protein